MKFKHLRQLGFDTKKEARKVRLQRMEELRALREKQEDGKVMLVVGASEVRLRAIPDSRIGAADDHRGFAASGSSARETTRYVRSGSKSDDRVMLIVGREKTMLEAGG